MNETSENAVWARVELMGHVAMAGRLSRPDEYGGLWQIDVPEPDGETYHTEFFGTQAVFRIRPVSEAIARAYAMPGHDVVEYDAPIVTRAEHENAMAQVREELSWARRTVEELRRRLIAVKALPSPSEYVIKPGGADRRDKDEYDDEDDGERARQFPTLHVP